MSHNREALDGIEIFAAVVEAKGFSAAAKRLGHTPSHISKEVSKLETRLGARLLNRTTRSIALTEEGQAYYAHCKVILETALEAERAASDAQATPKGVLRVSAPVSFGLGHLRNVLPEFMGAYPALELDVELNDRMINVVDEGFDLAIRVGRLQDSSLIARKLTDSRGVVVGAPAYWDHHGRPAHPVELKHHRCISYSNMTNPSQWVFKDGSKNFKVDVNLVACCNSAELEAALAVAGVGVTRLPYFACQNEIAAGELEIVLEAYEQSPLGLYAIYPHRAYLPAKTKCFVEFLERSFKATKPKPVKTR